MDRRVVERVHQVRMGSCGVVYSTIVYMCVLIHRANADHTQKHYLQHAFMQPSKKQLPQTKLRSISYPKLIYHAGIDVIHN